MMTRDDILAQIAELEARQARPMRHIALSSALFDDENRQVQLVELHRLSQLDQQIAELRHLLASCEDALLLMSQVPYVE